MQGHKSSVVLEVRATDARAAESWVMHAMVQQRLAFYSHRFAPFAEEIFPGGPDLACDRDPVHIGGLELDVVDSPASVNCMVELTADEV